ncbi:unnamed protein product [Blepharisma stoltei]|uniref:Uncharacterized protein n=1 Tax=Blepharisma stoltei TaxID=1481888 RepID=A0AAU9I7T0_9CILI|nr:unnamed protein product [Blepharisma stoltei]
MFWLVTNRVLKKLYITLSAPLMLDTFILGQGLLLHPKAILDEPICTASSLSLVLCPLAYKSPPMKRPNEKWISGSLKKALLAMQYTIRDTSEIMCSLSLLIFARLHRPFPKFILIDPVLLWK